MGMSSPRGYSICKITSSLSLKGEIIEPHQPAIRRTDLSMLTKTATFLHSPAPTLRSNCPQFRHLPPSMPTDCLINCEGCSFHTLSSDRFCPFPEPVESSLIVIRPGRSIRDMTSLWHCQLNGGKVNTILPFLADDHQYQYQSNASNQLQLFGNVQSPCGVNPVWMNKLDSQVGKIREHQQLQISLNHSNFCNEYDLTAAIHPPDLVSTGLRLSYDEDEHNSSLSSAGGSMSTNPSIFLSLDKNTGTELDHQNEEFDQYVKVQMKFQQDHAQNSDLTCDSRSLM
ncbi:hypothetical protein SAY86_017612 [Trapa natans]|uniref:Uncharacterized protein n=1 Tax=Trapa natans TaxID=22666 RepID=A0AAN7R8Z7_TRANT|nr:hypothetical protein SAY86_017612 [Trapa natans]